MFMLYYDYSVCKVNRDESINYKQKYRRKNKRKNSCMEPWQFGVKTQPFTIKHLPVTFDSL